MPRATKTPLSDSDRRLLETAQRLATSAAADVQLRAPHTAASLQMIATAIHTVLKG